MSRITYTPRRFRWKTKQVIDKANEILEEYAAQGFVLTLRQLYYQFVARAIIPNKQEEYKKLGKIVGDARMAGKIDWLHLEDRSRRLASLQHFDGPQDALNKLAGWYHVDMWANQRWRPEVWIEKDALSGVIAGVCQENDVPYFSCRGYASLSEMWRASQRLKGYVDSGHSPYIIHFGDHDPSGMDMSNDICKRLQRRFLADCEFKRVALNMDQVEKFKPPPNPAKQSDSRYPAYVRDWGRESWELDALEPSVFREIIEGELEAVRDDAAWKSDSEAKSAARQKLVEVAAEWETLDERKRQLVEVRESLRLSEGRVAKMKKAFDNLKKDKRRNGDK